MGVPISFGVDLPGLSVEKPPKPQSSVATPLSPDTGLFDLSSLPDLGTGLREIGGVAPGTGFVTDRKPPMPMPDNPSDRSATASASMSSDKFQEFREPARKEPEPPVSRQPIIETQPAVDFMSTFLSQPIDPTRRAGRQQTIDVATNTNVVPVENQKTETPAQTLVQDGKSHDWKSFISSFLMGAPGFDQIGGSSFDQMGGPPIEPMESQNTGRQSEQPATQQESQIGGLKDRTFTPEAIVKPQDHMGSPSGGQTSGSGLGQSDSLSQTNKMGTTGADQINTPTLEQMNILPLAGIGGTALDQTGGQINQQGFESAETAYTSDIRNSGATPIVSDLKKMQNPFVGGTDVQNSANSATTNRITNTAGGAQMGGNVGYQVSMNVPNDMQNVIGLSGTRQLDTPQPAEITAVEPVQTPVDSFSATAGANVALGLSQTPLTSFEGASAADLQKLKLLEVAQRLLLQERGIKDPQADAPMQTFTPQGMPGSIDSLLASLNQVNSIAAMIQNSLNQGQIEQRTQASPVEQTTQAVPVTTTQAPSKNIKLGEWSSSVALGNNLMQDKPTSIPIGNIFAGRFLQSGAGLPSVTRDSSSLGVSVLDQAGSIPIDQSSLSIKPADSSTSPGGGFSVSHKLALPPQYECRAVKDPTSKYHFYRLVGAGRIRFRCALGTAFDEDTCECSIIVLTHGKLFSFCFVL